MDLIADQLFECILAIAMLLADIAVWLSEIFREEQ
jgi:hypothetical protein